MKKISYIILIALAIVFSSCEKGGDIIKGTWKDKVVNSSIGEIDMTYKFDGKGHFKHIYKSYETVITKGTYVLDGDIVRTYYTTTNYEGVTREGETALILDTSVNPPTLSCDLYDNSGHLVMSLRFVKQ